MRNCNSLETIARAKKFAKKLRKIREGKGIRQSELSRKTNIPVDTIRSIENCRTFCPNIFLAYDLIVALDSNLHEILKETGGK